MLVYTCNLVHKHVQLYIQPIMSMLFTYSTCTLKCYCDGLTLHSVPYSGYISSEFNFVLFVLILFERIYSERKFNVGVTASMWPRGLICNVYTRTKVKRTKISGPA